MVTVECYNVLKSSVFETICKKNRNNFDQRKVGYLYEINNDRFILKTCLGKLIWRTVVG